MGTACPYYALFVGIACPHLRSVVRMTFFRGDFHVILRVETRAGRRHGLRFVRSLIQEHPIPRCAAARSAPGE
jgi:hypothetical protein